MIRQARLFLCALQFLTRLPTPRLVDFQPDWIDRSAPYYPVVGWVVGLIVAGGYLVAQRFWPGLPAATVAVALGWIVTGGFHEDGLADTADGLGGGQTQARRLEIMKDSRVGSFGVLMLWTVLTLKVVTLATLAPWQAAVALVLLHGAARAFPVAVMATLPYARPAETAKLSTGGVRAHEAVIALALGLIPVALFMPPGLAVAGIALSSAAVVGVALIARRLVGGYTGDILGAVEQAAEIGLLLGFAAKGLIG